MPAKPMGDLLVPVLDLTAGAPDPVSIATWHLALSNLIGTELPHQLLALWVFPERGGVILLGPEALAQDHLEIAIPDPHLGQDQLFELEETFRRAKYASSVAVPVRTGTRDVGVLVIGTFEPGSYGPAAARGLHQLAERLAPSLTTLGSLLTAGGEPVDPTLDEDTLPAAVARTVSDAPTGPELVRRLSGLLHPHLPHDRLEILAIANGTRAAIPLSGLTGRRRWGAGSTTWGDVTQLLTELMGDQATVTVDNLGSEAPGLTLPGGGGGAHRVAAVIAARLMLGSELVGMIVMGHAVQGLYRAQDELTLERVAGLVGARVAAFRLESEVQALRGQLEVLQAPSLPVLRAAESLGSTAHLGEALHRFAAEVREVLPHDRIRFLLRLSDEGCVELSPETIRPLADLPLLLIHDLPARAVLENERPWTLTHRHESEGIAVGLRVAGRVIGAMIVEASHFDGPREAAAVAQQFATVIAPHLELVRRSATARTAAAGGKGAPQRA